MRFLHLREGRSFSFPNPNNHLFGRRQSCALSKIDVLPHSFLLCSSKLIPMNLNLPTPPFSVDSQRTVCFSGYRIGKMPGTPEGCDPDKVQQVVRARCTWIVERLCEQGYDTFISGMATGFDLWAAEAVLSVRHVRPGIRLLAFVPYREQAKSYDLTSGRLYAEMLSQVDYVYCLSEHYTRRCCLDRNLSMLDHSSVLICYYDGRSGGTSYTVTRALSRDMTVINLCCKRSAKSYNLHTTSEWINGIRAIR